MLVSHILREKGRDVIVIAPEATLSDAARILTRNRIGALLVQDGKGDLIGIISERDIVRAVSEEGSDALGHRVAARMTKDVATCEETDTIEEIMETMTRCRFRHMPVVEGARVAGIVSIGDVSFESIWPNGSMALAMPSVLMPMPVSRTSIAMLPFLRKTRIAETIREAQALKEYIATG